MKLINLLPFVLALCFLQYSSGQNADKHSGSLITITGKVLNSDNNPVKAAVFFIDDVETNFRSRNNGTYKLKVSPEAIILGIRMPGYSDAESLINGQTNINFVLKPSPGEPALKTAVKTKDKNTANPDINPVKHKARKINTYPNIFEMIRGEVSGVIINGTNVQVQQGHSFFGSSCALFVVNGVIVNNIDYISPMDVKSITVLKRSEASNYGERGTNGVVIITLLSGADRDR